MENSSKQTKPLTFEATWAALQETDRILTEKFAKTEQLIERNAAEAEQEWKRRVAETEQRAAEEKVKFEQYKEESRNEIKELQRLIGGMGNSNGDMAESYFINSFTKNLHFAGQEYDSLSSNLSKKVRKLNLQDEYDLVLYNGSSVVIIEIKYKAEKADIEDLLKKALTFKQLFPEYTNYDLYLGLAGISVNKKVEKEATKQGVAVIKQVGDTMVINDKELKVF